MSFETKRINEIAKELNMTSKEILEKLAAMNITGKTHSSTLTPDQERRLKDLIKNGPNQQAKKPKAFVVKKAKNPEPVSETPVAEEKKSEPEEKKEEAPKRPQIEIIKPKSRLEIVRRAPQNPANAAANVKSSEGKKFPPRSERPERGKKPFQSQGAKDGEKSKEFKKPERPDSGERKPIQRHIISQEIYENKGSGRRRSDNKHKDKDFNSKKEEQERISLEKAAAQKHKKRVHKEEEHEAVTQIVVDRAMTISELAEKIQKTPAEIVKFLMFQGIMATVNQLIDIDVIKKICAEYNLEVLDEDLDAYMEEELEKEEKQKALSEVDKKLLKKRAPVVSIMGHVDHGKTTLLDSIRASKHKIVATEVGGITQSIGAYTVYLDNNKEKKIVFVDTPGHEAFTEMRARGAQATDIAILVVAADDGIMPQTIEAINHAKAANVPIIVAVNKVDKPDANPDKILQQLTEHGLVPEAWGGDTITVKVSALQGTGIDELLEYILLVADLQDLKANPKAEASGVVIEANLDKGKGPVATLLVQNGTLRVGNCIVVGTACGRVRALLSDSGERINKAEPSTPVEILGLTEVPQAGDHFEVVKNEKEMKAIVEKRKQKERDKRLDAMLPAHIRREAVAGEDDIPQLNLIIKANTHGAAEAVSQAIAQLESKEIKTKIS